MFMTNLPLARQMFRMNVGSLASDIRRREFGRETIETVMLIGLGFVTLMALMGGGKWIFQQMKNQGDSWVEKLGSFLSEVTGLFG